MEYTEVIYLITKAYTQDAVGNQIPTNTETKIYAKKNNVTTKEFYNALQVGITPTYEFQIRKSNYAGQSDIKYNDIEYHVIRTIEKSVTDIVLVVEKKTGNK